MNRKLVVGAALAVAAAAAAFFVLRGPGALRVGVILPFTGPNAAFGLGMRDSIRLAVDEANARGGVQGRKVELVELDDASDPTRAVAAATRLADDARVVAALVHYNHDCFSATRLILKKGELPNILAGVSTVEELEGGGLNDEVRLLPYGKPQMKAAAAYAWDVLGARNFLYVREASRLGLAMAGDFRNALGEVRKAPGPITRDILINQGDADFSQVLAQVAKERPDYVLFGGHPREAALLLTQLRAAGFTGWFQSATHAPSQEFIDIAKDKAEGALQVFHGVPVGDTPAGKAYLDAYAKHGFAEPPSIYGIFAYAEAQALLGAMDKSFLTRPSISGALHHEEFQTALGPIRFNYFSSSYQTTAIYKVIQGRWVPIYTARHERIPGGDEDHVVLEAYPHP